MRAVIRHALEAGGVTVVGEAETAQEAGPLIDVLRPDALTLDIEMPGVDGLEFLDMLMAKRPMPVVMFSSHTKKGAAKSIQALASGAFDCIGKPTSPNDTKTFDQLVATVRAAIASSCVPRGEARAALKAAHLGASLDGLPTFHRIVAMGAATGGVEALIRILARYPTSCPPTLVAQQIQPSFLDALIETLDAAVRPRVKIAEEGEKIEAGRVYFSPADGGHMTLRNNRITMVPETDPTARQPSINYLFESVAREAGPWSVGAILTGMGADGAEGLLAMRKAGAVTFAQTETSCTVSDMPKAAIAVGAAEREVSLDHMANAVLRAATKKDGVVEPMPELVASQETIVSAPADEVRISDQISPALRALR